MNNQTKDKFRLANPSTSAKHAIPHLIGLKVRNVRCFHEISIEFPSSEGVTILLGRNGSGKSTILQLLALGLSGATRVPNQTDWCRVVKTGSKQGSFQVLMSHQGHRITLPYQIDLNDHVCYVGDHETLVSVVTSLPIFGYGPDRYLEGDELRPGDNDDGIASLFGENRYLCNPESRHVYVAIIKHYPAIEKVINRIFEALEPSILKIVSCNDEGLMFVTPSSPSIPIPLACLSPGCKTTILWLLDMLLRMVKRGCDISRTENLYGVVLIDHIELHQSLKWQYRFLSALRANFPKIQFFGSTYSPHIAQSADTIFKFNADGVERPDLSFEMSYMTIVSDLFGIHSQFNEQVERQLIEFRAKKQKVVYGQAREEELNALIKTFGPEVQQILARELNEMNNTLPAQKR